jgi:hypothetical protein
MQLTDIAQRQNPIIIKAITFDAFLVLTSSNVAIQSSNMSEQISGVFTAVYGTWESPISSESLGAPGGTLGGVRFCVRCGSTDSWLCIDKSE